MNNHNHRITIGRNVKALREGYGLSQEALAKELGVIQATISHIENGIRAPSWPLAERIAKRFDITLNDLKTPKAEQPEMA